MRQIVLSTQFKKDLKLARKRNLPEAELLIVVHKLANDEPLEDKYHDHMLIGKYKGYNECHIQPDWLLVYNKTDRAINVLNLYRTGTHSDLFGK